MSLTPSPGDPSLWVRLRRRIVRALRGMSWVRRRDAAAARADVAKADRILFLCYGNICRSPFAERVARRLLPDSVDVASSGVHPTVGRPSPEAARSAARRLGVDLEDHASARLTPAMLGEADVIFVFDVRNWVDLLGRDRAALARTHFLGNLDPSGPLEISDPWGESEERFVTTYRRIRSTVESLAEARRGQAVSP